MTPAGIEPATFRFVAQHLNHCATAIPTCHSTSLKLGLATSLMSASQYESLTGKNPYSLYQNREVFDDGKEVPNTGLLISP